MVSRRTPKCCHLYLIKASQPEKMHTAETHISGTMLRGTCLGEISMCAKPKIHIPFHCNFTVQCLKIFNFLREFLFECFTAQFAYGTLWERISQQLNWFKPLNYFEVTYKAFIVRIWRKILDLRSNFCFLGAKIGPLALPGGTELSVGYVTDVQPEVSTTNQRRRKFVIYI